MIRSLYIWRDRRGDLSVLRIVTLLVLITPVIIALVEAQAIARGARPINDLIHRTGYWALIFLLASLAVTPLRRIARFGGLIDVRRMIGVAAFCYAAAHIGLYVADQMYDLVKVATEIARRITEPRGPDHMKWRASPRQCGPGIQCQMNAFVQAK